jgi:hypothetical protein
VTPGLGVARRLRLDDASHQGFFGLSRPHGGSGPTIARALFAPGWPELPARWTSSAKGGVGSALDQSGRVWFTLSHGILNEIYYPRVDQEWTRDLGFIVTDRQSFFSEEKQRST